MQALFNHFCRGPSSIFLVRQLRPGPVELNNSQMNSGFPAASAVKNPPANAHDARDTGSIPRLGGRGRSLEKEMATHSSILAWETPWTEEPGGLESTGLQKSWTRVID